MTSNSIPTTPLEVEAKFRGMYDTDIAECMIGIFYCNIGEGMSILDSYKHALLTYIEICKEKGKEKG